MNKNVPTVEAPIYTQRAPPDTLEITCRGSLALPQGICAVKAQTEYGSVLPSVALGVGLSTAVLGMYFLVQVVSLQELSCLLTEDFGQHPWLLLARCQLDTTSLEL